MRLVNRRMPFICAPSMLHCQWRGVERCLPNTGCAFSAPTALDIAGGDAVRNNSGALYVAGVTTAPSMRTMTEPPTLFSMPAYRTPSLRIWGPMVPRQEGVAQVCLGAPGGRLRPLLHSRSASPNREEGRRRIVRGSCRPLPPPSPSLLQDPLPTLESSRASHR